ncbi:hypothetical protein BN2537_1665 [Streptomyces venezuelae]|nr:hypothetical protein BN2537_1665 [Streptomyces venezuelae]
MKGHQSAGDPSQKRRLWPVALDRADSYPVLLSFRTRAKAGITSAPRVNTSCARR